MYVAVRHRAEDRAALTALFHAVSTPGNALYGQHLTRAQLRDKIPPAPEALAAVSAWLATHDVTMTAVGSGDTLRVPRKKKRKQGRK